MLLDCLHELWDVALLVVGDSCSLRAQGNPELGSTRCLLVQATLNNHGLHARLHVSLKSPCRHLGVSFENVAKLHLDAIAEEATYLGVLGFMAMRDSGLQGQVFHTRELARNILSQE